MAGKQEPTRKVNRSISLDVDVNEWLESTAQALRTTASAMINETLAEKAGLMKVPQKGSK